MIVPMLPDCSSEVARTTAYVVTFRTLMVTFFIAGSFSNIKRPDLDLFVTGGNRGARLLPRKLAVLTLAIHDEGAFMGIEKIAGAVTGTWNAITTAIEVRDEVKLNSLKVDMSRQLLELYTATTALAITNAEQGAIRRQLEEEIAELRKKADVRADYVLCSPYPGTTVYRFQPQNGVAEPEHYVCPACMDGPAVKSILQFSGGSLRDGVCPACKTVYIFKDFQRSSGTRARMG
ncbi:hypothetical protein NJI34_37900 [Pseudomonas sp. S 311-6]|nr:hypothetical protein CBF45_12680 [Bordetella sp. J329]MCO7642549.1 hypothetical protein [Pseudomonas sp. S 311-6]